MLLFHHRNAGQDHSIRTADRSLKNVEIFKYLERTITSQNLINEEISSILNSGNACRHSVQKP
jgi:hypothetical protein